MKNYKPKYRPNYKMLLCIILMLAMMFVLLTSCNRSEAEPSQTVAETAAPTATVATFNYSEGLDENGNWAGIKALDYVTLFDYKALSIPSDTHQITDEELQAGLKTTLADYCTDKQIKDRKIVDGDTVNIDYVGSVDGVEFEGGSTEGAGADVTIGVTQYIDDFLEQLIGHTPGETFDINVTFPEDYQQTDLQGKDAVFVTTVNYIVESELPELTDEFVNTNLAAEYTWKTVTEMKEGIKTNLKNTAIQEYVYEYLCNVTVSSIPESLTKYQENYMIDYYQNYADSYSMELDEFLETYIGVANKEELIENSKEDNLESATVDLVVQAVAEDAGITVSDEDITEYFTEQMGSDDYSSYEEQYGIGYLKKMVLGDKVLDYIVENAVLA